jgi:hypothetical protein
MAGSSVTVLSSGTDIEVNFVPLLDLSKILFQIGAFARKAASTMPGRLGGLHASNVGLVAV